MRSLAAKLRESKKKVRRKTMCAENYRQQLERAEAKIAEQDRLLRLASARLMAFAHTHPNYKPQGHITIADELVKDARTCFEEVDENVDIKAQMKADPSGFVFIVFLL